MVYAAIKKKSTYQYLQLFAICLLPWGLFFSEALASILMIIFAFPVLIFGHRLNRTILHRCWPFFLIYGLVLAGGFWSSDTRHWINLLRANLPYIVLPAGFALWPGFLSARVSWMIRHFVFAGVGISLYLLVVVLAQPEMVLMALREGGSFDTPVHHVRTSLFLAVAGVFAWHEWGGSRFGSRESWLSGIALLLVIVGIHILAVRTGIILFYFGTVVTFLCDRRFHTRAGYRTMLGVVILVIAALIFFPTIREKWMYFLEDIQNAEGFSWWFYSDAVRWESNVMGWEIFRKHPWWGVGMGDLWDAMHMQFYMEHGVRIWQYPHNLWITFLAGSGLVGFVLLNLALGKLFVDLRKRGLLVFQIIFAMYLISCLVENTLLTSMGAATFVLFYLMATNSGDAGDQPARERS